MIHIPKELKRPVPFQEQDWTDDEFEEEINREYEMIIKEMEKQNIRYETTLSGRVVKIDVDAENARIKFLENIRERLCKGEITAQEATKLTNEFGRKHPMFIK